MTIFTISHNAPKRRRKNIEWGTASCLLIFLPKGKLFWQIALE